MQRANDSTARPPWIQRVTWRLILRVLLIVAGLALTLAAGTGTLAGFAGRDNWRMELFCHLRVQLFWMLLVAAVLFGFARQRVLLLVAAALAAINLVVIVPLYFGRGGDPPASRSTIRALSLNVHFINRSFRSVVELVRHERPDFAFFYEVTPAWADALAELKHEYPYSEVMPAEHPVGIALYSKHKIANLEVIRVGELGLRSIVAVLETPNGPLTAIGVHPASPRSEADFHERNRALEDVAKIAASRTRPVVLVGDLNTTSWSPHFQDLVRDSGLRDSRYGFGVQPTWPWLPLPLRIPIDHCLVSPDITVIDRRVGKSVRSDHYPVLVDFAF